MVVFLRFYRRKSNFHSTRIEPLKTDSGEITENLWFYRLADSNKISTYHVKKLQIENCQMIVESFLKFASSLEKNRAQEFLKPH